MKTLKVQIPGTSPDEKPVTIPVKASSSQFSLSNRDLWLGLLMAALAPVALQLYELLMAFLDYQPVKIDWRLLLKTGISSGAAYLAKNFFDRGKVVIDSKTLAGAKNP